jgi:formylmethanofuran dehydrogenase subunit B
MVNPVTCPFCALHCDDLRLHVSGGQLELIAPACPWATTGFRAYASSPVQQQEPKTEIAVELMKSARSILMVLAPDVTNETVDAALRLAQKRSASLTTLRNYAGWAQAVGTTGWLSATLGDIKALEGAVLFFGVAKEEIPPRFPQAINQSDNKEFIHIAETEYVETARWLRVLTRGDASQVPRRIIALNNTISKSTNGVIVLGDGLLDQGEQPLTEVLLWLEELNHAGRWYGLALSRGGNGQGISETLLRLSGHPGSVTMRSRGADYTPRELSGLSPEASREADVLLWIGEPEHISAEATSAIRHIPTVVLSHARPGWKPTCWIQTAHPGIEMAGSMLRMDGVPVSIHRLIESTLPSTQEILDALTQGAAS